jgi:hypothetical protein
MSKTQKPCSARKCSKAKQPVLSEELNKKFFESLRNKKPSAEDIERRKEEDYLESIWGPDYPGNPAVPFEEETEEQEAQSNVELYIGNSIEDTELYVEGTQITGCIKATLEFDVELGLPTLTLTVLNPQVGSANS